MKNFSQYIKEAQLRGNKGVPNEFIDQTDQQVSTELGVRKDDLRQINQLGGQIMSLINRSNSLLFGRLNPNQIEERLQKLEKLAEDVIRAEYQSILDNVDLEIKFVRPGKSVIGEMSELGEVEAAPKLKKIEDQDTILAIDAAKLRNNIIQGEAKNTKNILHSDQVKSGLEEVLGADWEKVFNLWDEITKIANKMDWVIPINQKAEMMERAPEGLAGACKVEWPNKEENDTDLTEKILKDLEKGDDIQDSEAAAELLSTGNPKIIALGVDFPMLLHETVKGIYELLSSVAIKDNEELAKTIAMNTQSFEDESEDFRYGPVIAAKLRDTINQCVNIEKVPNIRERVYGRMCLLPDADFLKLMMLIIKGEKEAINHLQKLVNYEVEAEEKYQQEYQEWQMDSQFGQEEDEVGDLPQDLDEVKPDEITEPNDYSTWNQSDLQKALDYALDSQDFTLARKISPFLKESKLTAYKNLLLEKKSKKR